MERGETAALAWSPARSGGEYAEGLGHVMLVTPVKAGFRLALRALDGESQWENAPKPYEDENAAKTAALRVARQLQHKRAATLDFSYCVGADCEELVREREGFCHPHAVRAAGGRE